MSDNRNKKSRSLNMSRIRSTNSTPEIMVRKFLFSCGLRYRKNVSELPGCPDIVLPKYKTVIFVNGCFWHRHENCKYSSIPKSNTEYWTTKLNRNVNRDITNYKLLKELNWKVIIVWECELKKDIKLATLNTIYNSIID